MGSDKWQRENEIIVTNEGTDKRLGRLAIR
jgi:hypothetical protein